MVRQSTGRKRDATRTKASILNAAVSEFATRGPAGTRVDEIAARAGVNKSLIYQYFGSKQELYAEALNSVLEAITAKSAEYSRSFSAAQSATDLRTLIRGYLENHLALMETVPEWPRLLSWENLEGGRTLSRLPVQQTYKGFLDRVANMLKPLAQRGLLADDFDLRLVAQAVMALTHFFVIQKGTIQHLFQIEPHSKETRENWLNYCAELFVAAFKNGAKPDPSAGQKFQ
ncbi:MAG: TetR/AcrR family transcriptional regulator [Planctomycetes bacterium]|nr:TetR/AcrR family transcriptional regulator [Planctomycetota bacterium]